jgi:hypothetical protein
VTQTKHRQRRAYGKVRTLLESMGGCMEWQGGGNGGGGLIGVALSIAKPQLAALIMAAAGVAIVFSISMFAVIASPLLLLAALLGRVRQEAQRPPRTRDALGCEAPVCKTLGRAIAGPTARSRSSRCKD